MPSSHSNIRSRRARRGNTIVLVTAILVLLVIIATAFVGRTRAVRQISAAQQSSAGRDGRGESVAVDVANEIAGALFAKPVDANPATGLVNDPYFKIDNSVSPPITVASSSWPRLEPSPAAERYSIDRDAFDALGGANTFPGDGLPDFGYNAAPYEVKAWTNWPDFFGAGSPWPFGPGSPNGVVADLNGNPIGDANPHGNPGFGDTRWLRSTEPERVGVDQNGDGIPDLFTFSHWSHLSWLPTPNNGWRVVADISNVVVNTVDHMHETEFPPFSAATRFSGSLATAIPYEQWLPGVIPTPIANVADFENRRNAWFGPFSSPLNYANAYADPSLVLPNFLRLKELGPPTDEFRPGTARNVVSRTFTDTDGDGFTDSFWFAAPVGVDRSIRTLVGVSIVDNSALLNANVATKFSFESTAGHTPSDLALVTSVGEFVGSSSPTTVGFFDGPINQRYSGPFPPVALPTYWSFTDSNPYVPAAIAFDRNRFGDGGTQPLSFLAATGLRSANGGVDRGAPNLGYPLVDPELPEAPTSGNPIFRGIFESPRERLAYFKISGLDSEQPLFGLTPFDAADEFELRAYHGNNAPYTLSRFEQAVSLYSPSIQGDTANTHQFLRSSPMREENDEYLDQLDARRLLVDNRRKLTMFNGARNETAPPWTWSTPYFDENRNYVDPSRPAPSPSDVSPDVYVAFQTANFAEWERQKRKIDLRRPVYVDDFGDPSVNRNAFAAFEWRRDLQKLFERLLIRNAVDSTGATVYQSYRGPGRQNAEFTASMIASYVANLECASDEPVVRAETLAFGVVNRPDDDPLNPLVVGQAPNEYFPAPSEVVVDPSLPNRFYAGMEKQPFIMEAFFGVVYLRSEFRDGQWQGQDPPQDAGDSADLEEVLPFGLIDGGGGEPFINSECRRAPVIAVQIANPYDTPISLRDFRLRFFGKDYTFFSPLEHGPSAGIPDGPILPPATLARPSTAIVYFAPSSLIEIEGTNDPKPGQPAPAGSKVLFNFPLEQKFLDFLDLEPFEVNAPGQDPQDADLDGDGLRERLGPFDSRGGDPLDRTLVFRASAWSEDLHTVDVNDPNYGGRFVDFPVGGNSIELVRVVGEPGLQTRLVVDRFDNDGFEFGDAVKRLFEDADHVPPRADYTQPGIPPGSSTARFPGIRIGPANDVFMTWVRASRAWALDVDTWNDGSVTFANKAISATELSPRYAFSVVTAPALVSREIDGFTGEVFGIATDPDRDATASVGAVPQWPRATFIDAFGRTIRSKPVFFTNVLVTPVGASGVVNAVYEVNQRSLPFVGDGVSQRGTVNLGGADHDWYTGSKGFSPGSPPGGNGQNLPDIARFADLEVMRIPFQMTQKDADFEQLGEILDVFLWGHVFEYGSGGGGGAEAETVRTFSEIMTIEDEDDDHYPGRGIWINRPHLALAGELAEDTGAAPDVTGVPGGATNILALGRPVLGGRFNPQSSTVPPAALPGYQPWVPALPAGAAIFDALTIDGPGRNSFDRNLDGDFDGVASAGATLEQQVSTDTARAEMRSFRLSHGFLGRKTPGLVNLNTAMPEVMQALPMLTRLPGAGGTATGRYSHFVDAIRSYRDRGIYAAPVPALDPPFYVPGYGDRGLTAPQTSAALPVAFPSGQYPFFAGMRAERGIASIGELLLMARTAPRTIDTADNGARASYSVRWLGFDPYDFEPGVIDPGEFGAYATGYSWSTDRTNGRPRQLPEDLYAALPPRPYDPPVVPFKVLDEPLGDAEDANLLFKGISNLVTTRSDVFTVYLRVRQVRQNPVTGVWDGTNPDQIVDDTRYVMCVDRSEVNSPRDQPRIVYFQKCPD